MENFIKINGICFYRFVGICKETGEAQDFYSCNVSGYRPPHTPKEVGACLKVAEKYYNACIPAVKIDNFGTTGYSILDVELIAELEAEKILKGSC